MPHARLAAAIALALAVNAPLHAQVAAAPDANELDAVEVMGQVVYRDRTDAIAPVLAYDLDYFQRFEPLTVGDMLKRVPSVTFVSDVLEYDGVRLRGLDSGYTQILINGKRVPGAGLDRSFFVDRIPAEIVERIEIVRSASADRSGDAVAGALNIVLRDGFSLDGGYARVGAQSFTDGEVEPTAGVFWGGDALAGKLLLGANVQGRRNPKDKFSQRFSAPGGTLVNTEVQTDVRSGKDYALTADYRIGLGAAELHLSGLFVRTDRLQDEDSIEYRAGIENDANLLTLNDNDIDIVTDNLALGAALSVPMAGGKTEFRLDYASIDDDQSEFEEETEYLRDALPFPERDRFTRDLTEVDIVDRDVTAEVQHERGLGAATRLKFGVLGTRKERETDIREALRYRVTVPNAPGAPPAIPGPPQPFSPVAGGLNTIEEDRVEPFVKLSGEAGAFEWEGGLRYERTDTRIDDATVAPALAVTESGYGFLLPSAHLRWNLDDATRLNLSVARTVRRPDFDQVSPALREAELGDNDLLGNPALEPEDARGLDAGIERRLGRRGIAGINLFYRDIRNLVEAANTGVQGSEGAGTFVFQPRNTGDGRVWGAEFDLSTPLSMIGWDDTGVFFNYSWLDSEIEDVFGTRRFNNQSRYVYNVGFIQELRDAATSFGVTFRKQGDAVSRVVGEEVRTSYDGDLEAFVEKRIGEDWTMRLTGTNLLDQSKDEVFDKFTTVADQIARDYDEYELESETGGRAWQVIVRYAF